MFDLPAQDRQLVPQDGDLNILVSVGSEATNQKPEGSADDDIIER